MLTSEYTPETLTQAMKPNLELAAGAKPYRGGSSEKSRVAVAVGLAQL